MSTVWILGSIGLFYLVWAGVVAIKWFSAKKLQEELYPKYIKDGTLKPGVAADDFSKMFMRVEGPRFGLYLFAAACIVPFLIVIVVRLFNLIWGVVWKRTGELPWFEVGELPHSLMLVFLYVAILFGMAWITMRRYHSRAPGSFKTELSKLNGDAE